MRCRVSVLALLLLFPLLCTGQDAPTAKAKDKWPIPSKEAQAKIEALVQELFKDELAKADKDAVVRARLAQTLLSEGKETKDDPAGRYVLFMKAHTLAAEAGYVDVALRAADELAADFNIPVSKIFQMKIHMLKQASQAENAPPEAYQSVIDRVLLMLDDTLDADDFASSEQLIAAAEQAARKLRSIPLVASMRRKQEEITRQQKEFARWQIFADRLAKEPGDKEANLEMGKYFALIKGNWERGLPLLAKGMKSDLQGFAQEDLALATKADAKKQLIVAHDWYMLGKNKQYDPAMSTQALLRAYHWYQECLNQADAKTHAEIEAKLQEIAKLLPAEYRIGEITTEYKKIDVSSGPVYGGAFTPDARRFLITGYDGALHLYNTKTGKEIPPPFEGHAGKVWTVECFNDGVRAVSGGFDSTVRLWNLTTRNNYKIFEGHKDYVRSVSVSANGVWVLSGGDDRTVRLWNLFEEKKNRVLTGHDHTVWSVALSRDGNRALSGSLDKTVRLWDTQTGEPLKKLEGHKDTVLCVAFMPDGRHAISGSTDKTLRLWDLESGKTVRTFDGSTGYVNSVAVSPDGHRILSGGQDGMVRLWDAVTAKEIRKLEGHRDQVWHVAFSRDGRLALSCGQDNTVRIWTGSR